MANTGPFDIGDLVTVTSDFTTIAGAATNPTVVTVRVRKPDGTVAAHASTDLGTPLTNPSVGTWSIDLTIDQAGIWWYRFEGTGAVVAAEEKSFRVRVRRVPVA